MGRPGRPRCLRRPHRPLDAGGRTRPGGAFAANPPAPRRGPDPKRLARLLADLDSEQYAERKKATEEIGKLGDLAAPTLGKALEGPITPEARRPVSALLGGWPAP
jgi:hypothetical protein